MRHIVAVVMLLTTCCRAQEARKAAQAVNQHAFEAFQLFRQMTKGNFCFSPFSEHQVAALLTEGSKGNSKTELLAMTHLSVDATARSAEVTALKSELLMSATQRAHTLEVANSIWAPKEVAFLPDFVTTAKDQFAAAAESLPSQDAVGAASAVNKWVRERTRGRIPALVGPSAFGQGENTVLLVNAVYLKAAWSAPFELAKTKPRTFQTASGNATMLPTMLQSALFSYGEDTAWQCLEMPFAGGDMSMLFLLPRNEAERARIEAGLKTQAWSVVTRGMGSADANVMLPRFGFSTQLDLKGLWAALGVRDVFDRKRADLTGMVSRQPCWVNQVVHEATIEVNETGAVAAAATALPAADPFGEAPEKPRRRVSFIANRPFLWVIQHRPTGLIVFMGRFAGE